MRSNPLLKMNIDPAMDIIEKALELYNLHIGPGMPVSAQVKMSAKIISKNTKSVLQYLSANKPNKSNDFSRHQNIIAGLAVANNILITEKSEKIRFEQLLKLKATIGKRGTVAERELEFDSDFERGPSTPSGFDRVIKKWERENEELVDLNLMTENLHIAIRPDQADLYDIRFGDQSLIEQSIRMEIVSPSLMAPEDFSVQVSEVPVPGESMPNLEERVVEPEPAQNSDQSEPKEAVADVAITPKIRKAPSTFKFSKEWFEWGMPRHFKSPAPREGRHDELQTLEEEISDELHTPQEEVPTAQEEIGLQQYGEAVGGIRESVDEGPQFGSREELSIGSSDSLLLKESCVQRRQYIKDMVSHDMMTVEEITPLPHTRENIFVTLMALMDLVKEDIVTVYLDMNGFITGITAFI